MATSLVDVPEQLSIAFPLDQSHNQGGVQWRSDKVKLFKSICVLQFPSITSETRSSWLNCALRDDESVYWVSIGHYEAVAVGN